MASRLLSRSKTLTIYRLLHPSALSDLVSSTQCLRGLSSFASHPFPDPRSAALGRGCPVAATSNHAGAPPAVVGHLLSGKIFSNITYSSLRDNAQLWARSLHVKAHGGEMKAQPENLHLQQDNISRVRVRGVEEPNCLKQKENGSSKVIAFSSFEGTFGRERKSELENESLKVKRMELSIKTTYALIPLLLLVSKTKLTTSMLVMCIYWQVYGFFKEIFLDYVHHEVTRKWVLIYFKLLLFILAKDTILAFDLE